MDRPGEAFAELPQRLFLVGHRWFATTIDRARNWAGEQTLGLDSADRFLIVVQAIMNGWCATLDTEADELIQLRIG